NGDNGDGAIGPAWIYRVPKPVITAVHTTLPSGAAPGTSVTVTVAHAVDPSRITIGGKGALISGEVTNPDGTTTFTVIVPNTLVSNPQPCGNRGPSAKIPPSFDVVYPSLPSGCTDTLPGGLTVSPPIAPVLTLLGDIIPFVGTITPPTPPAVTPTVAVSPA